LVTNHMRILLTVEFYYAPGGGGIQEQARQIAEGLRRKGHNVTVATSDVSDRPDGINGVKIKGFRVHGNLVRGINGQAEAYTNFLLDGDYDVMINFAANVWTTDLVFPILNEFNGKKILSTPGLSRLGSDNYEEYHADHYLPALDKYDAVVYTSANYQDKLFGDENGKGAKAVIIPNGASPDEFLSPDNFGIKDKLGIVTQYLAISVSNHYLAKGHRFVIRAFRKLNREDTTLLIIGEPLVSSGINRMGHFALDYLYCLVSSTLDKRIILMNGSNRDAVLSAYKNADLFLFGSELECAPLVMYESFAAKIPFVTRDVGNVEDHREYVKIIDTPEDMARAADFLLDNPSERERIAEVAYQAWGRNYTWVRIVEKYDELFEKLMHG